MGDIIYMEIEEDEEEDDLDFNPLLRGETHSEASSSLSSENEVRCDHADKRVQDLLDGELGTPSSILEEKIEKYRQYSGIEGEGNAVQLDDTSRKYIQQELYIEGCDDGISVVNEIDANTQSIVKDNDDAIFRRTRARHSLANHSLEDLEAFLLQEPDEDDDIHNVDEEAEYHRFLAAVLMDCDGNELAGQGERSFDEEEENDADFEIELEEALESDAEEITENSGKHYEEAHVPETRQKKRLKESARSTKSLTGQSRLPLRPILPYTPNSQRPNLPPYALQMSSPNCFSGTDLINGFTACQIGQLYCLAHEHVQLLLQTFSVCVLDPSRQQIVYDLRKLISEMIERLEMALSWRKVPYPMLCFQSSNLYSTLQFDSNHTSRFFWTPVIDNNSVFSILDLAPLRLAKNFMVEIKETVSRYRQSCLEEGSRKSLSSKEPLFLLPMPPSLDNISSEFLEASMAAELKDSPPSSSCQFQSSQQQPKKSLAATIVESTMKQSIALVPTDIAKLAQRFLPLFNAALFPHKPPAPAVANRVLFTDAEDGLLAMGIMEHNNDWLAIQQHYLPCKSKHQIFVRQKNRSSSKAPENPIKAVRRMKSSPLTEDEKTLIYEGLRIFKHDWLSVWKYFAPHRDLSLLPRQWRIATGTQKSYKKTEAIKEKRRLYEAKRRRLKASLSEQLTPEKETNYEYNSEGDMDCEEEAYVHEAFLADSEAGNSKIAPLSVINNSSTPKIGLIQYKGSVSITNSFGGSQMKTIIENACLNCSKSPKDAQIKYGASYNISSRHLSSCLFSRSSGGHLLTQSYRARKKKGHRIVKLAPDLPPVNLPPSVRVISQSAFKIYHSNTATKDHTVRASNIGEEGLSMTNSTENTHRKCDESHQMRESTSEFDVQLHPLLFHNPSHFSVSHQNNAPSSFNFIEDSNCSVDRNATPAKSICRSEGTIYVHPLLQRLENSCDEFANGAQSECQFNEMNDIDLNIHLSCSAGRQKTVEKGDHQNADGLNSELFDAREKELIYSKGGFELQGFHVESNPGIVMEQEELSDSMDESENVEFECEDLEDSEDEELCGLNEIHEKASSFPKANDEIEAANHLRHLQQASANKKGKNCRGAAVNSRLRRLKSGSTKSERSCKPSISALPPPTTRSRRRVGEGDSSALIRDSSIRATVNKAAGPRRSKRRPR